MEQKCTLRACKYGPGAVGVGWELGLMGLAMHLTAADRDGARRTGLVIRHHGGFHGLNPAALYSTIKLLSFYV